MFPPNVYVEAPVSSVSVFGAVDLKGVIEVKDRVDSNRAMTF